jgi:hypothetical protein
MAASCISRAGAALLVAPVAVGWSGAPLAPAVTAAPSLAVGSPAVMAVPTFAAPLISPSPAASVPLPAASPALAAAAPSPDSLPAAALPISAVAAEGAPASPFVPSRTDGPAPEPAASARFWDGVSGGASPEFVAAIRDHVARTFPPAVLRGLQSAGYRVEANAHVRQNRPELDEKNDSISGYHAHGPDGKLVVIGETVREGPGGKWEKGRNWENAVNHEVGLAINRLLGDAAAEGVAAEQPRQAGWYRAHGFTESPEFRDAWRQDYDAMPAELKREKDQDGERNDFYYFLTPDEEHLTFHEARERTFAEGLDVLLRGPRSAYNYDDFTLHFPRALASIRREMEARFGWRIPEPEPLPARRGAWENPDATSERLSEMLVSGAASPAFVAKVRALVARTFPPDLIRDLLKSGYRVAADRSVRQGREGLHEDNDLRGGFHSHGANGNLIVVAEKLKLSGSGRWVPSEYWENAVIHEIGHALAYIHGEAEAKRAAATDPRQARWYRMKGLSESPAFREAWNRDFDAMPAELKAEWTADKLSNPFYYYVHPDAGGWFQRARQETYAEGFDVLLRGARSTYNSANFARYFPRALAELKRELGGRYPGLFAASSAS